MQRICFFFFFIVYLLAQQSRGRYLSLFMPTRIATTLFEFPFLEIISITEIVLNGPQIPSQSYQGRNHLYIQLHLNGNSSVVLTTYKSNIPSQWQDHLNTQGDHFNSCTHHFFFSGVNRLLEAVVTHVHVAMHQVWGSEKKQKPKGKEIPLNQQSFDSAENERALFCFVSWRLVKREC